VLAMTAQSLRTGGRDTVTKLFDSLMDKKLRSEAGERRDQLRRERTELIAEANLAAKSADHLTYMHEAANDAEPEPDKARVWGDLTSSIAPFLTEAGEP
jgi:hypothetical protein